MSESNNSEPFATTGSGKSEAEVAFELVSKLKGQGVWGERNQTAILDMFAECLDAVKGLRVYEGQKRVNVPILDLQKAAPQQSAPVPAQAPVQAAPAPAPSVPAPTGQTVQAQQQQVQQYQAQQQAQRQG